MNQEQTYTISVSAHRIQKNAPEYAYLFTEEVKTRNGCVWPHIKGHTLTDKAQANELYFRLCAMDVSVSRNWV